MVAYHPINKLYYCGCFNNNSSCMGREWKFWLSYNMLCNILFVIFLCMKRVLMHVMKGVRVALRMVMIVIKSNFTGGMVVFKDNFKDHNIMCNIVALPKSYFGYLSSFSFLVSLLFHIPKIYLILIFLLSFFLLPHSTRWIFLSAK